jgi:hypothetical protein
MGLVLLLVAGVMCWALFTPCRKPVPDEDLWFILSQLL